MTVEQISQKFITNPKYLDKGAGYLSKQWECRKEEIYEAKEIARAHFHGRKVSELEGVIAIQEEAIARYIGSEKSDIGTTKKFESTKPLSPEEIEKLASVDNINTYVARVWDKLLPSGVWTYSIDIRYRIKDFYSKEELEDKLKDIFPDGLSAFEMPKVAISNDKLALFVYIADDHVGLEYSNSLYGSSYSCGVYKNRMKRLAEAISCLNVGTVKEVYIIRLGDEADGYNARTTRYDHALESLSNKDQFDIFTSVNKEFYDTIFSSGISEEYTIVNCNNSNHSGLGFSYILNKSLQFYLEGKFPSVNVINLESFIGGIEWGNHVIGLVHGKDEKYMRSPMPLNLDPKTDLWLFEYYDNKGYSPSKRFISTIKGDLHKYNVNDGRSGRYVNVPSIAGGSPYIEHNYGFTLPGALIEFIEKDSPNIVSQIIRL